MQRLQIDCQIHIDNQTYFESLPTDAIPRYKSQKIYNIVMQMIVKKTKIVTHPFNCKNCFEKRIEFRVSMEVVKLVIYIYIDIQIDRWIDSCLPGWYPRRTGC